MTDRVACRRCGAHRDLTIAPRCLVCGAEAYGRVLPTPGDLVVDPVDAEVLVAAEAIDLALHDGAVITASSRLAIALRNACRHRALALAGRKAS